MLLVHRQEGTVLILLQTDRCVNPYAAERLGPCDDLVPMWGCDEWVLSVVLSLMLVNVDYGPFSVFVILLIKLTNVRTVPSNDVR